MLYHNPESNKIDVEHYEANATHLPNHPSGSKMVGSVMDTLRKHKDSIGQVLVHHDWTPGFWNKMKNKHNDFHWPQELNNG